MSDANYVAMRALDATWRGQFRPTFPCCGLRVTVIAITTSRPLGDEGTVDAFWRGWVIALVLLLASCGGGDDDGEGGGGSGDPRLAVSTNRVEMSADAGSPGFPTTSFTLTITNPPKDGVSIGGTYTQNGIESIGLEGTSATTGTVTIVFKNPSVIGADVYEDVIQLGICADEECSGPVSGTVRTVDVVYTVTGTPPPQPSVTASRTLVTVQSAPFIATSPQETVTLTLEGVDPSNVQINTESTSNGLAVAYSTQNDAGGFDINLLFTSSEHVGLGTHVDTVTVSLCQYNACPTPLDGSPIVITTRYEVGETIGGENGYTIRQVMASAKDVVWDRIGERLYLSSPSSAPENPNSVVELDPVTGELGATAFAGSDPTFGAVSDDGQYLYMGFSGSNTIRRFELPGLEPDITVPLGNYPSGPLFAGDIQVFPGQPGSIAVARSANQGFPGGYDVAVYDDDVQRPDVMRSDDFPTASIQFGATPDVIYSGDGVIATIDVDPNGLSLVSSVDYSLGYGLARIHFDSGVLYTDRGQAIEPVTGTLLGTYAMEPGDFGMAAAPDAELNRIFFLVNGVHYLVRSYDLTTFAPIAEIPLSSVDFPINQPLRIVRWGEDGLAIPTNDGRVLLINGPFVKP